MQSAGSASSFIEKGGTIMSIWVSKGTGKVRDIFESDDKTRVMLVASDHVSAFDEVLPVEIPDKGKILTQISGFWFRQTEGIAPNAFITCFNDELSGVFVEDKKFAGRCTMMKRLNMIPVEAIVRGYATGALWSEYLKGSREFCGNKLPEGLRKSESLPKPIFTPSTKAPIGEHDQNLTFEEMIECIKKAGFSDAEFIAERIRDYSLKLYDFGKNYAKKCGILIAGAKFEFGIDDNGIVVLGDELLTPDSARFWKLDDFEIGKEPPSMDKQIIHEWIKDNEGNKNIPEKVLERARNRYIECYERIVGGRFIP